MNEFDIGHFKIAPAGPVFVIAEIGANFEHSFERACELVVSAARAGAHAVKFQTYNPETNVTRTAPKFWDIEGTGSTQYEEQKDGLILNREQYRILEHVARENGVVFFSSVCDREGVDLLASLDVPAYKLSSMEITNLPFLEYVASRGKPVFLSTGASNAGEIRDAVRTLKKTGNNRIVLLHCVSNYPTTPAHLNLSRITTLRNMFPDIPAGYSDHTLPDLTPHAVEAAVALGARVIEKHFTFDPSRPGYDHELSAGEPALKTLVENCRIIETALGRPDLVHTENEERVRLYGRRGAVSRRAIRKGERFSSDNVIVKRPATGIQPRELDRLYGSAASRDIPEDHVIDWEMVERS